MQLFGVAAHDRVVAAQMRAVAERLESAARGSDSQFPKLLADAAHFL